MQIGMQRKAENETNSVAIGEFFNAAPKTAIGPRLRSGWPSGVLQRFLKPPKTPISSQIGQQPIQNLLKQLFIQ